eukprot:1010098-Pelagomonas_calceolata.AAC.4
MENYAQLPYFSSLSVLAPDLPKTQAEYALLHTVSTDLERRTAAMTCVSFDFARCSVFFNSHLHSRAYLPSWAAHIATGSKSPRKVGKSRRHYTEELGRLIFQSMRLKYLLKCASLRRAWEQGSPGVYKWFWDCPRGTSWFLGSI